MNTRKVAFLRFIKLASLAFLIAYEEIRELSKLGICVPHNLTTLM